MTDEKMDSLSSGWGDASRGVASTPVWGAATSGQSISGSEASSSSSLGWSMSNVSQLGASGSTTNSSDRPPSNSSAGMLNTTSQPTSMWLGLGLDSRESAGPSGDWGQVRGRDSRSNSVIGLDISTPESGDSINSMGLGGNLSRSGSDQWGKASSEQSGWGQPPKSDSGSGWGSPTTGPLVNAGTEVWGGSGSGGNKAPGGQNWGNPTEERGSGGWGQQHANMPGPGATGWGSQTQAPAAKPPQGPPEQQNWNQQPPRPSSTGWGGPDDKLGPSAWGAPGEKPAAPNPQWGGAGAAAQPPQQQPPQQQQPQWGGSSQPQPNNPHSAWGNGNTTPSNGNGMPKPIGTQPPMGQPPQPQVQQQPQQPPQAGMPAGTSWAQAAGRGLGVGPPKPGPPGPSDPVIQVRSDAVTQAVNNNEGWGKTPVRQDRSWDNAEDSMTINSRQPPQQKTMGAAGAEENTWNQPNTGTAIWEATKEPSNSSVWGAGSTEEPRRAAGASGSANDNDLGTWNGPDNSGVNNSNMWNGPPQNQNQNPNLNQNPNMNQNNQWGNGNNNSSNTWSGPSRSNSNQWSSGGGGGGGGGGSSSSSSDNAWDDRSDNTWTGGPSQGGVKADNMWDRNGTSVWGGPSRTEPPPQGPPPNWRPQPSRSSSSSWGEDETPGSWSDNMINRPPPQARPNDNGPGYWGGDNSQSRPQPWNSAGPPNAPMPPHPQQGMGPPMDDKRTSVWGQPPPPSKPSGWGDPGMPNSMEDMWKQGMQQPANYPPSSKQPFHMRSQLLQHLMDMGFKKEDAQDALIRSNMNLNEALNFLASNIRRPDFDLSEAQQKGRQVRGVGSDVDPRASDGHMVPPVQNTPYANAQSQLPTSQMMGNPMKQQQQPPQGPSLQMPSSSLGSASQPSINPSLQQLMPPQLQKQQQPVLPPQGQPIRGQLLGQSAPATATQQPVQQQQQHIVHQLQMAVQAGLISPQLLNQQLTPNMLVMLQHLLQLQQLHQQLVTQHQQQVQKRVPPLQQRQKLDNLGMLMQQVRQQIQQQQRQISIAQQALVTPGTPQQKQQQPPQQQQPPPLQSAPQGLPPQAPQEKDAMRDLPNSMSNLSVSRLNQWKLPSPDSKDSETHPQTQDSLAPGSKPSMQPHSMPNLQSKADTVASSSLSLIDSTWSSSSLSTASTWPTTSAISTTSVASTTTPSSEQTKDNQGHKESPEDSNAPVPPASKELDVPGDGQVTISSAASTSSTGSNDSSGSSAAIDMIEEFVPGKIWQGNTMKNTEDDPYLTPGSMPRSAFGIAGPKSAYYMNRKDSSISPVDPNLDSGNWPLGTGISKSASSQNLLSDKPWSSAASPGGGATTLASELWGVPSVKNTRPPPGLGSRGSSWQQPLPQQQQQQQQSGLNRSISWAPGDRSSSELGSGSWAGQPSCFIILKNITPQVDANALRMLCGQHGNVLAFHALTAQGQVLVRYHMRDEAMRAQRSLNAYSLNNTMIRAEFVSEQEVGSVMEQASSPATSIVGSLSQWSQSSVAPAPPRSAPFNKTESSTPWNGATSIGSSMWGGGLWAPPQEDRHAGNHFLPENLLGGH